MPVAPVSLSFPVTCTVSGTIFDTYNSLLPNVTVQAFDKDLRTEQLLGNTITDVNGFYKITYEVSSFALAENKSADVFIRVLAVASPAGQLSQLGQSPVNFNVPENFTLDFKIDNTIIKTLNEFDRLINEIQPLLVSQNVEIKDLKEDSDYKDISFLAGETGEDFESLSLVPLAYQVASSIKIDTAIFYGLFRLKFPTSFDALLQVKSESIANGIKTAISENIISSKWLPQIGSIINMFDEYAAMALASGTDDKSVAVKKVLVNILTAPQQNDFINAYLANENTPDKFWDTLSQQSGFTETKVINDLQNVLQLNMLTGNVPSLTALIFSDQNLSGKTTIRSVARLSQTDWKTKIDSLVASGELNNFPGTIDGTNNEEKSANYAAAVYQTIKALYPTDIFASELNKNTDSSFKSVNDLKTFLTNNIDFDLKTTTINASFKAANLAGINNADALKNDLTTISRLNKLTGEHAYLDVLNKAKLTSATAIVQNYSALQFEQAFANAISPPDAALIYTNAHQVDKRSTALALSIRMRNDIGITAITGTENNVSPDYESMFGDTNCDCEDCLSVYSASAYLTDILHFLKQNNPGAFGALTLRRPDITHTLLTCENTNTPLPYIDLVNELLENNIAPQTDNNGNTVFPQTTTTAEELAAYPQYINTDSYKKLAAANSSYNLSLNLFLEETRMYLDKAGIKRYTLMELFFGKSNSSKFDDLSIATEYLQLNNEELNIVNGTTPLPVTMNMVNDFLNDTGLTYIETLQLLECYFVNPLNQTNQRSITIVAANGFDAATCNIDQLQFQTPSPQSLKVVPFIRLWRKTGWNIFDLDRVLNALNVTDFTGNINSTLIIPVSHIFRLKNKFNISIQIIVSLWKNIDTSVYCDHSTEKQPRLATQYESLFQNKKITTPVDADLSDPLALSGTLAAKAPIIIDAFNLSQKDFDTLSNTPFTNGNLTLQNLSSIYGYTLLSKALKLPIDDLISLINITTLHPIGDVTKMSSTLTFIDKVNFIRSTGFSVTDLNIFLGNTIEITPPINVNNLSELLESVREGLRKIELLVPAGSTALEQAANKKANQNSFIINTLATAFKTESKTINVLINDLVKIPEGSSTNTIEIFINDNFINSQGSLFTIDTNNQVVWQFPDVTNAYILLSNTWNRISNLLVKWKLSGDEFIYFEKNQGAFNINEIWNLPMPGTNLYPAFENLYNLVLFRNSLISTADWYTLFDIAMLNSTGAKKNFIDSLLTITTITFNEAQLLLGAETDITDTGVLKISFPQDYLNAAFLLRVISCSNNAIKPRSTADIIFKLTINPAGEDFYAHAELAKSILKSKYDESSWLQIITPISNQLRSRKRDALIAFILTDATFESFRAANAISDTNALFAYFLIDVEMDSCMMTSRIKQAISGIQLFIDRCLMNLETAITLTTDFAIQWNGWRNRYRMWEANREIFLYPENWIEPELRDDKSPFFKELESTLKQNEVTDDTVTDALLAYLEKLDTVANLEIIGFFPDELTGIVHVAGRTRNLPHQYYYTRQVKGIWSAWEKIDIDIEGDNILLVVWNNRLMLFWGLFTAKQANNENGFQVPNAGDTMPPPASYLEIKLAWSEYKNGAWKSKKQSKDFVSTEPFLVGSLIVTTADVSLSSAINNGTLDVRFFIPYRTDINDVFLVSMGGFKFDGCNNAPSAYINENFDILKGVWKILKTDLNEMMISESIRQDSLALYKSGIYLPVLSTADNKETTIFNNTPGDFKLLPNHHQIEIVKPASFFYNNGKNNFYSYSIDRSIQIFENTWQSVSDGLMIGRKTIQPVISVSQNKNAITTKLTNIQPGKNLSDKSLSATLFSANSFISTFFKKLYYFQTFYHPYVCELIKTLNTDGIGGLYKNLVVDSNGTIKEGIQNRDANVIFIPQGNYDPSPVVAQPYPVEQVDFNSASLYSIYNWELFFHIPLLIATSLSQNQQFEAARKWFHYIFDPTQSSIDQGAKRFWITKPFKEEIQKGILSVEDLINNPDDKNELDIELNNWENNPFNPHAVARTRHSAYMRSTVMKYIDNLIAWGDQLFRVDTIESINEATLLYVLAANILGKKPEEVPARAVAQQYSYSDIQDKLNSFSNAKVAIQSFISLSGYDTNTSTESNVLMPMFCIPKNDILLGYWDTVADRLFKIRHCLNIDGVFQQLPLFEPPIDPGLLVRATAAGVDLNNILTDMTIALPNYRFQVMLQKALELCSDVKVLGSELLSALEKKDAEQLSLIRSGHELNLLNAIRDIKLFQIDEANRNLESLNNSSDVIQAKRDYYASREYRNTSEKIYFDLMQTANTIEGVLNLNSALASLSYIIPQTNIGPWIMGVEEGGLNIGNATMTALEGGRALASSLKTIAEMANMTAIFQRRQEEWNFQTQTADLELKQMSKQIATAEIRVAMAEKDLENHDLQISQSTEVDNYLRDKFTNEELYNYMTEQISTLYFQSYQIAYNTAKQAEKCMQYELGIENTSFIQFGYWDSLKKGLLSGEKLQYDLRRLENAYMEQNERRFEITKYISLANLNANAILEMRTTGLCNFQIPELLFEMDFPGHYLRRIKSVSVSIPCIAGPYTSVSSQLSLNKSFVRTKDDSGDTSFDFLDLPDFSDPTTSFTEGSCRVKAIATSNAQSDSGMFEFIFRDERYLPFEGAGVISDWNLELPTAARQFDYNSISDVIISVRYTAKDSANTSFKTDVNAKIKGAIAASIDLLNSHGGLYRLLSLKNDFPDEFYTMKSDGSTVAVTKQLTIGKMFFPYFNSNFNIIFKGCAFYNKDGSAITFSMTINNTISETIDDNWKLLLSYDPTDLKNLEDIYLLLNYSLMTEPTT